MNYSKRAVKILERFHCISRLQSFTYVIIAWMRDTVSLIWANFCIETRNDRFMNHAVIVDDWWKKEREGRERRSIRVPKEERRSVDPSLEILRNHIRANNSLRLPRDSFVRIIKINSNDFLVPCLWCHCLFGSSFYLRDNPSSLNPLISAKICLQIKRGGFRTSLTEECDEEGRLSVERRRQSGKGNGGKASAGGWAL